MYLIQRTNLPTASSPLVLKVIPYLGDWERMPEEARPGIRLTHGTKRYSTMASQRLDRLLRSTVATPFPHLETFTACVMDGANILSVDPTSKQPILHYFFGVGDPRYISVLLKSPVGIDWTVVDPRGATPLHLLITLPSSVNPSTVKSLLRAFIQRLERSPQDVMDWAKPLPSLTGLHTNSASLTAAVAASTTSSSGSNHTNTNSAAVNGVDVISLAASKRRLAIFWEAVKDVPYFKNRISFNNNQNRGSKTFTVAEVHATDWELLSVDDRQFFKVGNVIKDI